MTLPAALLCAAAAMPSTPWAHPTPLTVVMVDNRFEPDHVTFHPGVTYALHLVNRGTDMHEFTAPDFLKSATLRNPHQLANGGTDIVVQPGKSITVLLIPRKKGQFDLRCADHDWDGMVGSITVN